MVCQVLVVSQVCSGHVHVQTSPAPQDAVTGLGSDLQDNVFLRLPFKKNKWIQARKRNTKNISNEQMINK